MNDGVKAWRDLLRQERAAARVEAQSDEPEEEQLVAEFKVKLPPMTSGERHELARFLDETSQRTLSGGMRDSMRTADWELERVRVIEELAECARAGDGPLTATVHLNATGRAALYHVLDVAARRAQGGESSAVVQIRDEFERFVWGRGGKPQEPPRRQPEPPGMWEPTGLFRGSRP